MAIPGAPPALEKAPTNCPFAPRCNEKIAVCEEKLPPNVELGPARSVRCVHAAQAPASA